MWVLGSLLPLHLSKEEMATVIISTVDMGHGNSGYAEASMAYLGVPLEQLDEAQAARLISIGHAPKLMLAHPDMLDQ